MKRMVEAQLALAAQNPEIRALALAKYGDEWVRQIEERTLSPEELAAMSEELETSRSKVEAMAARFALSPEELQAMFRRSEP